MVTLLAPGRGRRSQRRIFQHAGPQPAEPRIEGGLDRGEGGGGVLQAPLLHAGEDLLRQGPPAAVERVSLHGALLSRRHR